MSLTLLRRRNAWMLSIALVVVAIATLPMLVGSSHRSLAQDDRTGSEKSGGPGLASGIFPAPDTDAQALAESLVGAGEPITVSNATLVHGTDSAGFFNADSGVIGFDSGIILTSGRVQGVAGPNSAGDTSFDNGSGGDADLSTLSGFTTFNATVLEFDFDVNFGQTVSFNYVFGSEEYHEFVNTQFNDVFAFFVNGVNCATVGDPPVPVSINTINGGNPNGDNGGATFATNPDLFRSNAPPIGGSIDTELDGLTVVLTCDAEINDGTNHMKLAIADASDPILDASVFLEAGSLTVNTPPEANDDSASTPKNTPVTIDVLANDTDVDGDPLTVSNLGDDAPANGSVNLNGDGTVTYTPNTGFVGTDTFTYRANDGLEKSTKATVTVEVFNQPPDAVDDSAQTFKHTSIDIDVLANDSDPDGDPLTIVAFDATSSLGGTVVDNGDGTLNYTSPNQSGTDTFTYTISDGLDEDTATVTIEIINQPPDCSQATPSVSTIWPPNHKFVSVEALGITDPDGDPLTITVVSISQDEPTDGVADGDTSPDGQGVGTSTAEVRAERAGSKKVPGNGRVYHITYQADDGDTDGTCTVELTVGVPHDQDDDDIVDDGALFDSTS